LLGVNSPRMICLCFSIVETEMLWNKFDEDRKNLDSKLTAAEHELSRYKKDDMTFQQMKDALPSLKVAKHTVHIY